MLDKTSEYHKMAEVESELWWYKALHYRIFKEIIRNYNTAKDIQILDSGCGTGGLILYLSEKGFTNITGFDLSDLAIEICKSKELNVAKADVYNFRDNNKGKKYDVINSSDILCYVEADRHQKIIDDYIAMLNPGGILLMNLPAFNVFKGEHDIAVGLLRRYNIKHVKGFFTTENFYKINCWPFILSPMIMANRIFQKLKLSLKLAEGDHSDVELPPAFINTIFYKFCEFEINHLRFRNWGSSIFIVYKKA